MGQETTNEDNSDVFGKCLGNVWEMFGKCLEHSFPDYQAFNMVFWEMFGKCLGNVWEMFGKFRRGWGSLMG